MEADPSLIQMVPVSDDDNNRWSKIFSLFLLIALSSFFTFIAVLPVIYSSGGLEGIYNMFLNLLLIVPMWVFNYRLYKRILLILPLYRPKKAIIILVSMCIFFFATPPGYTIAGVSIITVERQLFNISTAILSESITPTNLERTDYGVNQYEYHYKVNIINHSKLTFSQISTEVLIRSDEKSWPDQTTNQKTKLNLKPGDNIIQGTIPIRRNAIGPEITPSTKIYLGIDIDTKFNQYLDVYKNESKISNWVEVINSTIDLANLDRDRQIGLDFDSQIGTIYLVKQADISIAGALMTDDLLVSAGTPGLYELKKDPNNYFLLLLFSLSSTITGTTPEYNLSKFSLTNKAGKEMLRNIKGSQNYIDTSSHMAENPEKGNISTKERMISGGLGFLIPKEELKIGQANSFRLTYSGAYSADSQTSEPISISITIK